MESYHKYYLIRQEITNYLTVFVEYLRFWSIFRVIINLNLKGLSLYLELNLNFFEVILTQSSFTMIFIYLKFLMIDFCLNLILMIFSNYLSHLHQRVLMIYWVSFLFLQNLNSLLFPILIMHFTHLLLLLFSYCYPLYVYSKNSYLVKLMVILHIEIFIIDRNFSIINHHSFKIMH